MKPQNSAVETDPHSSPAEPSTAEPVTPVATERGGSAAERGSAEKRGSATKRTSAKRAAAAEQRARGTRTWLEGSRTARAWNGTLLAYTAVAVGAALVLSVAARTQLEAPLGPVLSSVLLWIGMAVPVVIALTRSRPRGLFRFRWTDLLWGLGLGVLLRIVQGWLEVAAGSPGGLPSYSTLGGELNINPTWLLLAIFGPVLILPLLEELLFRGVVLVSVYRMARHGLEAGMLAIVASTGAFVAIHAVNGMNRWDEPVYLTLVGLTCGMLVLFTGRIWGAVLVHMVFNGMWVALALTGTALA